MLSTAAEYSIVIIAIDQYYTIIATMQVCKRI